MLNRLRHPRYYLRSSFIVLACAALLVRALVPVGYMLGSDAPDGGFAVLLCPAHAELPADSPTTPASANGHLHHSSDHTEDNHQARAESCAFSLALVPLITPPESNAYLRVTIRDALFFEPRQRAFIGNSHSTISARGPPQHS